MRDHACSVLSLTPRRSRLPVARYAPFPMAVGDVLPVSDFGSPLTLRVSTNLLVAVETVETVVRLPWEEVFISSVGKL